ncbi:8625_t:CDS:10 [Ambispora leptoticha]|uniref:8625_t:CDS:1 n=1 Tax=Ambispora leptoticha TaxID=144679 RepID=A0A9N8VBD6_9GLOM|nr:8625_t:CDS:10 [Ambispora leptoticha]
MSSQSNKQKKSITSSSFASSAKEDARGQKITSDPRFVHVHQDPRFIRPKKKDIKVTLDKRFAHMLKNKEFSDAPKIDKYGRPLSSDHSKKELKRFYVLDNDDDDESNNRRSRLKNKDDIISSQKDLYDFSRGRLDISSSSSEDEESEDDDNASLSSSSTSLNESLEDQEDTEQEEPIPLGDETRRFAAINLDWDNVKATDLMKVFSGFCTSGTSIIKSVKIYPSEFGKKRIELESREGPPKEIFKSSTKDREDEDSSDESSNDINGEMNDASSNEFEEAALRKYQLERLKFECDSVETARHVYQQCDGAEFESTANFFDLRFIPNDMNFDDDPVDECYEAPAEYKPVDFVTEALQHSNVKLTWDNDDPDRVRLMRKSFTQEDLDNMDFKAYLASSDEDEEEDEDIAKKYKSLLSLANNNADDNSRELLYGSDDEHHDDQEMEVTFTPGISESLENETTLEAYLRKQREKKKAKKKLRQEKINKFSFDQDNDNDDSNDYDEIKKIQKTKNNPRFAALHESHHFAIDPSSPQFKRTKAMEKLLQERQRRQLLLSQEGESKGAAAAFSHTQNNDKSIASRDPSLSLLVKSVKRKNLLAAEKQQQRGKRKKIE